MAGRQVDRNELAARVVDVVRSVSAMEALTARGSVPSQLGAVIAEAEQRVRDTAVAFVSIAGLLYPEEDGAGCPSGEGWAFIDALRSARAEGSESVLPSRAA